MRIAIDAREILDRPTGVGRYLLEILRAWGDLPEAAGHEFVLCAPHEPPSLPSTLRLSTMTGLGGTVPRARPSTSLGPSRGSLPRASEASRGGTLWEQRALPRLVQRAGADVLFAPAYTSPLRCPAPVVLTIHDVSFAAHPEWFTWREGFRRRMLARLSARRAARVIADSEFSKREIAAHLGVDRSRIDVIHLGSPHPPSSAAREPLVLYVGSIFNRRHLPVLIDGFARVAARHSSLRLELVGDNRTHPPIDIDGAIARSGAADRIRVRPYVSDAELSALYAGASAFAFLSEYEGFGLTPLEAMAGGVPIVVLDTDVAREIYGPAAEYVERPDPALVASALERVLTDDAARTRLLQAGAAQLQRYSWSDCARRTLQVLLKVGSGPILREP
jgi:glycosyltransferase involved in cell wall biosynthesis